MSIFRSLCCVSLALIALAPFAARANDSSIDTAFNPIGVQPGWRRAYDNVDPTANQTLVAAARAPDGGYVLAGYRAGGTGGYMIFLAKFRPDGTYDSSFGGTAATGNAGSGRVLKDANFSSVRDMTVDAQGRIVVVGITAGALGQSDFGVVRFNPNGTVDTSFSGDGSTYIGFDLDSVHNRTNDAPTRVTTAPDGSVYIAGLVDDITSGGAATTRLGVAKLMPDGENTNTGYGTLPYGRQVFCGGVCENLHDVARIVYDTSRNRLVIGGDNRVSIYDYDWFIVTQDLGAAATVQTQARSIDLAGGPDSYNVDFMTDLAVQADGKVVALGLAYTSLWNIVPVMLRTQPTGLGVDNSFGNVPSRGLSLFASTPDTIYRSFAIDSSGRFVVVGDNYTYGWGAVMRLLANGSVDSSFNGTTSTSGYFAETTNGSGSAYSTTFNRVFLDGTRPVLVGSAPDSHTDNTDYDLIITRLQSDSIFANGFQ